ncbi:MAG: hypothetical protein HY774_21605 [Acidobacteria bacterium]|nr:hypothetical protein [Acidobacteriota bacterium]
MAHSARARMGAGSVRRSGFGESSGDLRILIQRPSGREPFLTRIPVGAPQSRLPTGYCPAPIRAKTDLSATE